MERCVYKYIHNYLLANCIITSHQSGFTRGDSAINQLLFITNEFGKALDEGKTIRVVFCDKSLHRGHFKIDETSLRSLGLSMSGPVAFEVSKVFNMSSTSVSVMMSLLRTKGDILF
jgi:hypothetical protein